MSKVYSIDEIACIVRPIAKRYGVTDVWLFGSYARGEATEDSDIDLLIDGGDNTSIGELSALRRDLERALQKPVDMTTLGIEDRGFPDHIRREEVRLYERRDVVWLLDAIDNALISIKRWMCTKQKLPFLLACASNLALLSVCLLYRGGGPLIMTLMPLLHILLFLMNMMASKKWWQVISLGVLHIAVTYCTLQQSSWLYFHYIVDDVEGRAIAWLECVIGVGFTTILFIASLIWFAMKQRKKRNTN